MQSQSVSGRLQGGLDKAWSMRPVIHKAVVGRNVAGRTGHGGHTEKRFPFAVLVSL